MTVTEHILRELTTAITDIIAKGRFADSVIQKKFFENKHWKHDERSLFAETCYTVIRNWRSLWYCIGSDESQEPTLIRKLLLAFFAMNSVPVQRNLSSIGKTEVKEFKERWNNTKENRALHYSLPDWMDKLCLEEVGERWNSIAKALHSEPRIVIRANTLKVSAEKLSAKLSRHGIETEKSPLNNDALIVRNQVNVFSIPEFREGLFEVQDAGSQTIAPFCQAEEGMRLIDACAGSGGKTMHLATIMKNKGRIIALDTEEWKLNDLLKRSKRAEISIIETRHINSTKVIKRLAKSAERVL